MSENLQPAEFDPGMRFVHALLLSTIATRIQTAIAHEDVDAVKALISSRSECGNWMEGYGKLHKDLLTGNSTMKPRRLVAVPHLSGLADRIIACVTIQMFALLTNRAFQTSIRIPLPDLGKVFSSSYISWGRGEDPEYLIEPLREKASHRQYNESIISKGEFFAINTINDIKLQDRFLRQDLNKELGSSENVMIVMNRGKTIRMFENSYHRDDLTKMGLTPDTAFGCIANFLFEPKPEIFAPFLTELGMLKEKNVLKIGIQIRAGDSYLMNNHHTADLNHFMGHFACAQQIEDFARGENQRVIWYLVSDSMPLRTAAKEKFGDKLVTSVGSKIEHSAKEASVCKENCTTSDAGIMAAAAEWWLFGACDYHVISVYSGYGRSGAMRSLRRNSIYTIDHKGRGPAKCDNTSFTDLENLSYDWSGIR